jgi:hypothetical protein
MVWFSVCRGLNQDGQKKGMLRIEIQKAGDNILSIPFFWPS